MSSDYPDTANDGPLWVYTASNTLGTYHVIASQVDLTRGDFFDMQAMVVDPVNPSTIYAGRATDGIYKSTDCGANWKKITGRNSHTMASGRSWTMAIDPSNPQTIYTNQG